MPDTAASTDARPRLLLLDGHSLAYRAFFALPVENFSTTTGQPTNAVYGFTSMLINVLRDEQPTHVGVAFDKSRQTFRLEQYADRRFRALSLGNAQRVGLAAALQHDPDVIVLDEPTNGLDPAGVILLRERLLARADAGAGILVSSHHLDEVARIAHRILVVNAGRMIGELDPHAPELEGVFFEHVRLDDERRAA